MNDLATAVHEHNRALVIAEKHGAASLHTGDGWIATYERRPDGQVAMQSVRRPNRAERRRRRLVFDSSWPPLDVFEQVWGRATTTAKEAA